MNKMATNETYDVIVIGAGIEGSSSAYNLAKSGKKVLLLEQFYLPHNRGSSHGQSRITRYAYGDEFYVRMMKDAFPMWRTLQEESGSDFFINCGALDLRQEGSPGCRKVVNALRMHDVPHEVINPTDFRSRYPMFKLEDNVGAVLDPSGGILKADQAAKAFRTVFQKLGGIIRDGCPVTSLIPGQIVKVMTPDMVYYAKNVVLATGAWSAKFASTLGLKRFPLKPHKAFVFYWRVIPGKEEMYRPSNLPCFLDSSVNDLHYSCYGVPMAEYPGLVKICIHAGPTCDPDNRDTSLDIDDSAQREDAMREVKRMCNWLVDTPSIKEDCIITSTPDNHPYIDRHPKYRNVVIAAGFCGHGFKLAPVVGKAVCEMVSGSNPTYNMKPFRLDRFETKSVL